MSRLINVIVTVLLLNAAGSYCQDYEYLNEYFAKVVASFYQKILDVGVSSLPVNDVFLPVNRTLVPGLYVQGNVSYTKCVVVGLDEVFMIIDRHSGVPGDNNASLYYQIGFPNLAIVCDVSANTLEQGSGVGTAELLFANSSIGVTLNVDYASGSKEVFLGVTTTPAPSTNFQPSTDLMNAIARLARLELGYRMLWDQMKDWCESTFHSMVLEAVQEIEFPIIPPETNNVVLREGTTGKPFLIEDYLDLASNAVNTYLSSEGLQMTLSDKEYPLNKTLLGVALNGVARITNGLGISFDEAVRTNTVVEHNRSADVTTCSVLTGVTLTNVSLLFDLTCELTTEPLQGSIQVFLPRVDFRFVMVYTFATKEIELFAHELRFFGEQYTYEPSTIPLQAVKILLSEQFGDTPWFSDDMVKWEESVLHPIFKDEAQGLPFPITPN